ATLNANGDVYGTIWNGWLSTFLNASYGQKNTASLAAGGGWWQDASTGLIMQMGIVNRTGYGTGVTFPRAFPNYCTGVLLTLNMNIGSLSDSDCNIRVLSHDQNGFSYGSNGEPEKTSFWVAFGK
ncbi:gp53-like domain-containing protein, partial [Enterobacter asburiae]|uniref:gp53-like domain-containing protein n=1 Tax=Enterobacter asburiae TaxID=61645 RepID=UPI003BF8EA8B|nr:phage tail protein [Enterobacter asburiae]